MPEKSDPFDPLPELETYEEFVKTLPEGERLASSVRRIRTKAIERNDSIDDLKGALQAIHADILALLINLKALRLRRDILGGKPDPRIRERPLPQFNADGVRTYVDEIPVGEIPESIPEELFQHCLAVERLSPRSRVKISTHFARMVEAIRDQVMCETFFKVDLGRFEERRSHLTFEVHATNQERNAAERRKSTSSDETLS